VRKHLTDYIDHFYQQIHTLPHFTAINSVYTPDLTAIFVDRENHLTEFQQILEGRSDVRGIMIYGKSTLGKTSLLKKFQDISYPYQYPKANCFRFDVTDSAPNWRNIIEATITVIGRKLFKNYNEALIEAHNWDKLTDELIMQQLANVFQEELQALSHPVIWIIDHVDTADPITKKFLVLFFTWIANQILSNLIIIVASTDVFHNNNKSWDRIIKKHEITEFDEEAIKTLLEKTNFVRERKDMSYVVKELFQITHGNPLATRLLIYPNLQNDS
jgi:hypothetical protein